MAKYNPETKEQVIKLKDGREIYKTHNGFIAWLKTKNGETSQVSHDYYNKCKKHKL
jgi:hypothetical protein